MNQKFDNSILNLVKQKQFYTYGYMSDLETFEEKLPIKEKLCSSLTVKKISDKKYEQVWNKFEMKTIKDYDNLYLQCDVLLLAGVFEKLRNNTLKNYGWCPIYYLNAPALSLVAMLNMTKIKLELISDRDLYIFFEKGMRSGETATELEPRTN